MSFWILLALSPAEVVSSLQSHAAHAEAWNHASLAYKVSVEVERSQAGRGAAAQDFFQVLRPGLQLLRPPKKDARDGAGIVAGFVGYNYDAFKQEFGLEPWQVPTANSHP